MADQRSRDTSSDTSARRARTALQALLAVSAVYGATGLVFGLPGFDMPVDWLRPLPLDSWVLPGVALYCVVAVPLGTAALAGWHHRPYADRLAQVACALLLSWLVFQVAFLGIRAPVQVITAVLATVLAVLTARTGSAS